jgi:hypothetical protein
MPSPSAALVVELGLEPPLQGTVESWLLDTMDPRLAYHIAMVSVWRDIPLVVLLQFMRKPTLSPMPLGMVLGLRAPLYIRHTYLALAALN